MNKQNHVLFNGLPELYENKLLTDVVLCVEAEEFPCHRIVLAASSPYFRAMFTSNVREQGEARVQIHEVDAQTLKLILDYIYTASVDVTASTAQRVFIAAHMMQLLQLVDLCADFMQSELCASNSVEILNFASFYSCEKLRKAARVFILEHFTDVAATEGFTSIDVADLESLLSEDDLGVELEEHVFTAVVKWVDSDQDTRQQHLKTLLKHFRIGVIPLDFITQMRSSPLLCDNGRIVRQLENLQSMQPILQPLDSDEDSNRHKKYSFFSTNLSPRLGMLKRRMLVFAGEASIGDVRSSLTCFDPTTNKNYFAVKQDLSLDFNHSIDYHRVISANDKLYFIGGVPSEEGDEEFPASALDAVFQYVEKDLCWVRKENMHTPRCAFSAVSFGGRIFITGGMMTYPRGGPLFATECYDTESDQWLPLADMPIGLYHHASAVYQDSIFVFGGIDDLEQPVDTVFQYSISANSWTIVETTMALVRAKFTAITHRDKIYLIGGQKPTERRAMEIFNLKSRQWQIGSDVPKGHEAMSAVLIGDCIYICGNKTVSGSLCNERSTLVRSRYLHKYDVVTSAWSKIDSEAQCASNQTCTTCALNTKFLSESKIVRRVRAGDYNR